jgi:excisionase family DNA binding protein
MMSVCKKDQMDSVGEVLLLKADALARRLSLGRSTVYELMASGELPTVRIGGSVRVPAAALEKWIAEKTR